MPKPLLHECDRRRALSTRGFTLLELLIVLVIIGVIISVTTIAVGVMGRDREMQDQAERLSAVLTQAREESELQGFDLGLRVGPSRYEFLRYNARQQEWVPVSDDDLLMTRDLPDGLRLRLWLEGREVILKEPSESDAADSKPQDEKDAKSESSTKKSKIVPPQIMLLSSGDLSPFDLRFERDGGDDQWHVQGKPDNSLIVEELHEAS